MCRRRVGGLRAVLAFWLSWFLLAVTPAQADEFDTLRLNWRETLTLGTNFNPTHPDYSGWINSITNAALTHWGNMRTDAGRLSLWNDLNGLGTDSSDITASYARLKIMALAHEVRGSALAGDAALLAAIVDGLEWMNANAYRAGAAEYDNWFDWQIAAPLLLNDIVALLYEHLSGAQRGNYMNAIHHFTPSVDLTGANRVWKAFVVFLRGVLVKDGAKIESARLALSDVFPYVASGEGFHGDGSFVFHEVFAYNGHYGVELIATLAQMIKLLQGSSWAVDDPAASNLFRWVYDSIEPFIFRGAMMPMVTGRVYTRTGNDHLDGHTAIAAILHAAAIASPPDAAAYKAMVKEWVTRDTFLDFIQTQPPPLNTWAREIRDDASIAPRGELVRHLQFPSMDRVVHGRSGWAFGLSMSSRRIGNYESTRGENLRGWYTGDGMTYLYNSDLAQYADQFWSTVNPYRLPGTTVDTQPRANGSGQETPNSTWVGGAHIQSQYGVAGMQLNAWNSSLTARKSWFAFDDEIVCLGSRIISTDNRTIETIVENRRLAGPGNNAFTVNGTLKPGNVGWSELLSGVSWAHLAGNVPGADVGYYFPQPTDLRAVREARSGRLSEINSTYGNPSPVTRQYLNLWMDHGLNPSNATYHYVLLPGRTASATEAYVQSPDVLVLQNSTSVQAVRENKLGITAANFWADGTNRVGGLTVNRKAAVIVRHDGTYLDIGLADPTQTNTGIINLELTNSALAVVSRDARITVLSMNPVRLAMDAFESFGRSAQIRFFAGALRTNALLPMADAFVYLAQPASNYGPDPKLAVKALDNNAREIYLKFDLGAVPGIFSGASLRLLPLTVQDPNLNHVLTFVPENNWTETGITWNNKPTAEAEFTRWPVPPVGTPVTVPINQLAQRALALPGKQLSLRIHGTATPFADYGSKENTTPANRPQLLLTLGQAPPAVTLTTPVDPAYYTSPATVELSAAAVDPDSPLAGVSFYLNGDFVTHVGAPPFQATLAELGAGNYTVTAMATDITGLSSTSAPVFISVHEPRPSGLGTGLFGEYFTVTNLAGGGMTRVDPVVNFDWGVNSPAGGIPVDRFSVRWTGKLQARRTGVHRFHTVSDEGIRLSLDGFSVINNWARHSAVENTGEIALVAGQYYDLSLEYYEVSGPAVVQLFWTEPGGTKHVIPQSQLYPAAAGLVGTYFANPNLSNPVFGRVDDNIEFSWGAGSPDPVALPGQFSVLWSGKVRADQTGPHTFHTFTSDGVRLWVARSIGSAPNLDRWTVQPATETNVTVNLSAGQYYDLAMMYFNSSLTAAATLMWTPPGGVKQVIPKRNLTPHQNNRPPTLNPWTNLTVLRGQTATASASATDPDLPHQSLIFSLGNGAPSGASINPLTGAFTWTPGPDDAIGEHHIPILVSDSGTPSMTDGRFLVVTVMARASLIRGGSGGWRYLDNGTDQGTAWRAPAFNDTSWALGIAPLGYGTGAEVTTVAFGPNPSAKYITTYFRRPLFVPSADNVRSLNLRVLRNDGVIVYLNGLEVLRDNMPSGNIVYTRPAQRAITGIFETNWISTNLSPALLLDGTNVIAAEIHQHSAAGPDIAFDLELAGTAIIPSAAPLRVVAAATEATLTWPAEGAFLHVYATDDLTPPVQWEPLKLAPTVTGGRCVLVLPLSTNRTQFFRLQSE